VPDGKKHYGGFPEFKKEGPVVVISVIAVFLRQIPIPDYRSARLLL
jgi:hypothetical protein